MPLTLHPDMVSRKALAAGSWREPRPVFTGGAPPCRSPKVALSKSATESSHAAEVVARTQQFALAGVTTLEASRTLPDILADSFGPGCNAAGAQRYSCRSPRSQGRCRIPRRFSISSGGTREFRGRRRQIAIDLP